MTHPWHERDTRSSYRMCQTWPRLNDMRAWHDLFKCVAWIIDMSDVTHLYVWQDSFLRATQIIHSCGTSDSLANMTSYLNKRCHSEVLRSTESRNRDSDSPIFRRTNSYWKFSPVWICTEESKCLRLHWKCFTHAIYRIERLRFLGTNSNWTKFSTWICTARYWGIWGSNSRFGGSRRCSIFSGICHRWHSLLTHMIQFIHMCESDVAQYHCPKKSMETCREESHVSHVSIGCGSIWLSKRIRLTGTCHNRFES